MLILLWILLGQTVVFNNLCTWKGCPFIISFSFLSECIIKTFVSFILMKLWCLTYSLSMWNYIFPLKKYSFSLQIAQRNSHKLNDLRSCRANFEASALPLCCPLWKQEAWVLGKNGSAFGFSVSPISRHHMVLNFIQSS